MTDSLLIFTFSPVQSFIAEARRAADLYAGSRILVELAKAAASAIGENRLIYPASLEGQDAPNKIVARVPSDQAESIGKAAKEALLKRWAEIANGVLVELSRRGFLVDPIWEGIWRRQTAQDYFWSVFWAAARMPSEADYPKAYREASRALDAVKHSRVFVQPETGEPGLKDSLSGSREALHTANEDAKRYWANVAEKVEAPELRPEGRERLDAFGAIKRFGKIAQEGMFFSTSTVAAEDFLKVAKEKAAQELARHRKALEQLLDRPTRVRNDDDWPYDGDLLFMETVVKERLKDSYRLGQADEVRLKAAQGSLRALYKKADSRPSPYYAIIVLDGDSMGEWISNCQNEDEHRKVGRKLAAFVGKVNTIVPDGFRVYNGGDDVLALAPLAQALPLAQQLAGEFNKMTEGHTASAGIAISHHLYPLDAALEAARGAEKHAKNALDKAKAAVSVRVLKRSGETVEVYSRWEALGDVFESLVKMFQDDALSSRFAHDVIHSAYALNEADEKFEAEVRRLLGRHRNDKHSNAPDPTEWARKLRMWADSLPGKSEELGRWLALARFVAQGGGE
jgi:CRISPR-associated protein Cmr2